jgi:hypothetical protein
MGRPVPGVQVVIPAPLAAPIPRAIPVARPSAPPKAAPDTLAAEDDAFYNPSGRIRSLADGTAEMTIEAYRPLPTLLVRAAGRRKRFVWVALAILIPLGALAAIGVVVSSTGGASEDVVATTSVESGVLRNTKRPLSTTSTSAKAQPRDTKSKSNTRP